MSDIPEELKLQILVRLPTKSLLRFRSVCKSWSLLISSSNFISSHKLHNQSIGNYNVLSRRFSVKETYILSEKCRSSAVRPFDKTIGELDFPFDKPQGEYYTVVGCVDGLICLWDDTHELNPLTLWNPAIRKSYQQLSVPVFVNGALHFLTRKDGNQCCIVSFSPNAETFVEMACPQGGKLNTNLDHQIAGSPETIFLFHQLPGNQYDIWVMKEYNVEESWTKLFSIILDNREQRRIISVRRNGRMILCGEGAAHAEFYSESLVLLGNDNCVTHLQPKKKEKKNAEARIGCTCLRLNEQRSRYVQRDINQREA